MPLPAENPSGSLNNSASTIASTGRTTRERTGSARGYTRRVYAGVGRQEAPPRTQTGA